MSFIQKYDEYIKNNPKGYWFKRKIYGWGWTPATWQGWLVTLSFIVFVVWGSVNLPNETALTESQVWWFVAKNFLAMIILLFICYKKGESPRWQWGPLSEEKNKKDE